MTHPDWTSLVDEQRALLTRVQLKELGVTPGQLRWRLQRSWRLVLPRVVAVDGREAVGSRQLVAALLEAGPSGVVTGHRACVWHGITSAVGSRAVQVIVPRNQSSRSTSFLRVEATSRPEPAPVVRGPLRLAQLPRAVLDAARDSAAPDEAAAVVIEAVQRQLVTVEQLEHELEAGSRRHSRLARGAVQAARHGAWSVPEAELLEACAASDVLPHIYPNPVLESLDGQRLISPDLWLDDIGLAAMIHSRSHHARDHDWEGTVERDGELTEHGALVLPFTAVSVRRDLQRVVHRLERTYLSARRAGRSRPPIVMTPRYDRVLRGVVRADRS